MGAQLVSEVLTRWTHVPDRAFRVLVRMALTALDQPQNGQPAGVYFGGRELLDSAMRPTRGTPETRYRDLKRAVAELVAAGAIERVGGAGPRHNQVYRLTLTVAVQRGGSGPPHSIDIPPVDNSPVDSPMGGRTTPPVGDSTTPPVGGAQCPEWGGSEPPPRNHEEPMEELSEEPSGDLSSKVAVSRARAEQQTQKISGEECPTCGVLLDPDRMCRNRHCTAAVAAVIPLRRTA